MKSFRLLTTAALAAMTVFVASCADSPMAVPTATVSNVEQPELLGGLLGRLGLLSCSTLPTATASGTFGPAGGTLQVGPHKLLIPAGALASPVTITGTLAGPNNRVTFQPHGLQFERSALLTMSYANCNTLGLLLPKRVAYVQGQNILEYLLSVDNLLTKKVTGKVDHFSEYAVAW
jgi:hypothetical protein